MGSVCGKNNSVLAKRATPELAHNALYNHLKNSPYHGLSEEEIDGLYTTAEIEEVKWATDDEGDEGETAGEVQPPTPPPPVKRSRVGPTSGVASSSSSSALAVPKSSGKGQITISREKLLECMDSVNRAQRAAEASARVAMNASTAWQQESIALGSVKSFFESLLR